jgi:hypothetical protein
MIDDALWARALRGAWWVAPIGFVGGLVAMTELIGHPTLPERDGQVVLGACVVALLGACVGAIGQLARRPWAAAGLTFVVSIPFAVVCAPISYTVLHFATGYVTVDDRFADELGAVAVIGGIIALPLGATFGSVYAAIIGLSAWAWRRGARARWSVAFASIGVIWALAGLALDELGGGEDALGWNAARTLWVGGASIAVLGTLRLVYLARWIQRVRRGSVPGYRVIAADEAEAPPLLPWGRHDGVIVRLTDRDEGPFRSTTLAEPLGRVPWITATE